MHIHLGIGSFSCALDWAEYVIGWPERKPLEYGWDESVDRQVPETGVVQVAASTILVRIAALLGSDECIGASLEVVGISRPETNGSKVPEDKFGSAEKGV